MSKASTTCYCQHCAKRMKSSRTPWWIHIDDSDNPATHLVFCSRKCREAVRSVINIALEERH